MILFIDDLDDERRHVASEQSPVDCDLPSVDRTVVSNIFRRILKKLLQKNPFSGNFFPIYERKASEKPEYSDWFARPPDAERHVREGDDFTVRVDRPLY